MKYREEINSNLDYRSKTKLAKLDVANENIAHRTSLPNAGYFLFIIDTSHDQYAQQGLPFITQGIEYWMDLLKSTQSKIATIAYNEESTLLFPFMKSDIPADYLRDIPSMENTFQTDISKTLRHAMEQFLPIDNSSRKQHVILFSGSKQSTSFDVRILSRFVEQNIRIDTVGYGLHADRQLLHHIAEVTGGHFEFISMDSILSPLDLQNYLIELSGEILEGNGIVTLQHRILPEPSSSDRQFVERLSSISMQKDDLTFVEDLPLSFFIPSLLWEHTAYIEEGSDCATFVLSMEQNTKLNFYLIQPDGNILAPATGSAIEYIHKAGSAYLIYRINKPQAGRWLMRVLRGQSKGNIRCTVFAFSDNKNIKTELYGIERSYTPHDTIEIKARVFHQVPLLDIATPMMQLEEKLSSRQRYSSDEITYSFPRTYLHLSNYRSGKNTDIVQQISTYLRGMYEGRISFVRPGSYSLLIEFINSGTAREATIEAQSVLNSAKEIIPPFMRIRRFQLHVGFPINTDLSLSMLNSKAREELQTNTTN